MNRSLLSEKTAPPSHDDIVDSLRDINQLAHGVESGLAAEGDVGFTKLQLLDRLSAVLGNLDLVDRASVARDLDTSYKVVPIRVTKTLGGYTIPGDPTIHNGVTVPFSRTFRAGSKKRPPFLDKIESETLAFLRNVSITDDPHNLTHFLKFIIAKTLVDGSLIEAGLTQDQLMNSEWFNNFASGVSVSQISIDPESADVNSPLAVEMRVVLPSEGASEVVPTNALSTQIGDTGEYAQTYYAYPNHAAGKYWPINPNPSSLLFPARLTKAEAKELETGS